MSGVKAYLGLVASIVLAMPTTVEAQLPTDLAKIAGELNCSPYANFFDREGEVYPPYLYHYPPRPSGDFGDTRAVFLCAKASSEDLVTLVFTEGLQIHHEECTPTVDIDVTYRAEGEPPNGLSVHPWDHVKLDSNFAPVNRNAKTRPRGETAYPPLLVNWNGGTGTLLYCYEGEWITTFIH